MPFLGKTPSQIVDPEVDIDGGSIDGTAIGATSASAATVTTFTSTGIDDNATSTAITIDSSQNVGIGKTPTVQLDVDVGSSSTLSRFETSNTTLARQYMYGGTTACQVDIAFLQNNVLQSVIGTDRNSGDTFIDSRSTNGDTVFYRTGSERMRLKSGGNLQITDGNLVVANGHGVSFAATADGPSMSSEVLDDYEEGTWTPAWASGSINHDATYTKIGNVVVCRFYMAATSACSGDITGLPFAPNDESAGAVGYHTNATAEPYTILVQEANKFNFRYGNQARGLENGKQARGMFVYTTSS